MMHFAANCVSMGGDVAAMAAQAAKALYAAAIAGLAALGGLLVNDTGLGDVTAGQWIFVALAILVAFGGVYGLPNGKPPSASGGG